MRTNAFSHALLSTALLLLVVGPGASALPGSRAATRSASAPSPESPPDTPPGEGGAQSAMSGLVRPPDSSAEGSAGKTATVPGPSLQGAPVTLDGEVLFHIYTSLGPYSKEERAERGCERILRLAEDPLFDDGLFTIEMQDGNAAVYFRGDLMSVVTPDEAAASGTTPEDLAEQRIEIVEKAIEGYRSRRLPESLLLALVEFVISTIFLIALLVGITRLHRRLIARVQARRVASATSRLEEGRIALVERILGFQLQALRLLRPIVIVFLVAVYLQSVFLFFPLTRSFAWGVLRYVLDPLNSLWSSLLANAGNFAFILVVLALTMGLLRALRWLANETEHGTISLPGVSSEWARPMHRLARLLVIGIVAVVIYPYIPGSSTAAFKGIGILAGALFTVGASSAAGNFIGGVALMFSGAFRIGDRVMIGEIVGDVVETGVLITRIRTPKNETVSVPNSALLSGRVVNYSAMASEGRLILHTAITIGYDAPWRKVHELLVQAALRTSAIEAHPAPFVIQKQLNDYFVTYEINACTGDANSMTTIYGELHQNIQDVFNEAGVEIMSPQYASLRDGNSTTIPESYRGQRQETRSSEPDHKRQAVQHGPGEDSHDQGE